MEKIKSYVERFFRTKEMKRSYQLSAVEVGSLLAEMSGADGNKLFAMICTLFNYGYAKGYRACQAEMKKGGA